MTSVPIGLDFVPDGVGSAAVVADAATLPFPVMAGLVEFGDRPRARRFRKPRGVIAVVGRRVRGGR